jgi:hypothetical protein
MRVWFQRIVPDNPRGNVPKHSEAVGNSNPSNQEPEVLPEAQQQSR